MKNEVVDISDKDICIKSFNNNTSEIEYRKAFCHW